MTLNVSFKNEDTSNFAVSLKEEEANFQTAFEDDNSSLKADFGTVQTRTAVQQNDYTFIRNKPSINNHVLRNGENALSDLGIGLCRNADISRLF